MRYVIRLAILLCCAFAGLTTASAEKRVALVIGNADYKIGRLANPVNDAEAVAGAFKSQLKFDQVILRKDLKRDGFGEVLREMARASAGAELGVVFFAGHGIEVGGRNYLVPIDAALTAPADIELEAIALDTVLRQLDGVTKLRLVILDACRNNPFPAAKRGVTRGLGRIEPDGGTLVAYAAKDGTTAEDGKAGRHSPFTAALLKRIVTPGLDVRRVFGYVSEDVLAATSRAQEPYLYGRLGGDEVHLIPVAAAVGAAVLPAPVQVQPGATAEMARICREVEGMSNPATLAVLERRHNGTLAGECVAARLAQLKTAAAVSPQPAPPPKMAEPAVAAAVAPGREFRDCADVCPQMVVLPAGEFTMGSPPEKIAPSPKYSFKADLSPSEGPQHKVTIARPFAVGKYEVTFAEWDACLADRGCNHWPSDEGWGKKRRPVINVRWYDAKDYVAWLSLKTGKTYRLLSEAEWEYAARGGTTTLYAFGDTITKSQAQFDARQTVEVGSFPANRFGLHDLHGNVLEWVEDSWHDNYKGAPADGSVWRGIDFRRVQRGGSWQVLPAFLRSAIRYSDDTNARVLDVGFRVARTL